jgi:hypothetical protein
MPFEAPYMFTEFGLLGFSLREPTFSEESDVYGRDGHRQDLATARRGYSLDCCVKCILSEFTQKTNLASRRAIPSGSDRLITQTITRPLVRLVGILSKWRMGAHHRSAANSEQSDQR